MIDDGVEINTTQYNPLWAWKHWAASWHLTLQFYWDQTAISIKRWTYSVLEGVAIYQTGWGFQRLDGLSLCQRGKAAPDVVELFVFVPI